MAIKPTFFVGKHLKLQLHNMVRVQHLYVVIGMVFLFATICECSHEGKDLIKKFKGSQIDDSHFLKGGNQLAYDNSISTKELQRVEKDQHLQLDEANAINNNRRMLVVVKPMKSSMPKTHPPIFQSDYSAPKTHPPHNN